MKRIFVIFMIVSLCLTVSTSAAFAGPRHYRGGGGSAVGAIVGVGAAIVGSALLFNAFNHERVTYVEAGPSCYYPPPPEPSGHWEIRKTWVGPVYERVWNPPHYNERSEWVDGQWVNIQRSAGYWKEERVWVAER